MKRSLYTLLALLLWASASYSQTLSTPAGAGTKADPYKIATLNNLYWMEQNVNGWNQFFEGKYLLQTADIDASTTSTWNGGQGWKPVGDSLSFHFKGNYDGGGHTISNLYINRPTTNCNGLFGYAELGSIRNLKLSNVNITGQHGTGALIGISLVPITGCSATGTVKGGKYSAGLVSINQGSIDTCFSSCTVVGTEESGGLVGASTTSINQCYCTGAVSGLLKIGGFIGSNGGTISDCYAMGTVSRLSGATATSFYNFVGYSTSSTYKSYATGKVVYEGATSPTNRGFGSYCSYSFNDKESSLQATGCASASTTAAMQQARTFALSSWDFKGDGAKGIWNIGNARNGGYPYLNWQYPSDPTPVLNIEPTITINSIAYSGGDTLRAFANITSLGSPAATEYGLCWAITPLPSIADSRMSLGKPTAAQAFSARISNLDMGSSYYVRAYIISALDTAYSNPINVGTYTVPAGTGTQADPYLITCLGDLFWMYKQANNSANTFAGKYFLQTKDINVAETKNWNGGWGWNSIGSSNYNFMGTYNGNHHRIDSLYGTSLFSYLRGATIKNLSITNCTINGASNAAALAGYASTASIIDSCHASGVVSGSTQTAGLVGGMYNSLVSNSSFEGSVTGTTPVGGLVALASNDKLGVWRCWANATVSGTKNVGGLVGEQSNSTGIISESFSEGAVSGTENVGGLIGLCMNAKNVYSRSSVTRSSGSATSFGALVGYLTYNEITYSYATGSVQYTAAASPTNKGISGLFYSTGLGTRYTNNFWDTQTSAQTTNGSPAEGKTTAQMTNSATFIAAGWDFIGTGKTGVWNRGNTRNNGYPYFSWQYPTDPLGDATAAANLSAPIIKRIAAATATIHLAITSKGIPTATQHGLCWNTTGMPTTANSKSELGVIASFDTVKTSITGLVANTLYHVRSYTSNANGTFYSPEVTFVYVPSITGSGSKADPYLINTVHDLFWLQQQCNIHDSVYKKKYFKQTANIDLSVSATINNGMGWDGIMKFSGFYDGDFHRVDGLFINRPGESSQGLWGAMGMSGKMSNLGVTNVNITANSFVGALIGFPRFDTIINCYATGKLRGIAEVGGLVGELHYTTALWSYANVDVTGERLVGGFAGRIFNVSTNSHNCYSRGSVTRSDGNDINIGSFFGMSNASISYSYSTGKVTYANQTGLPTNKGFIGAGAKYTFTANYFDNQTTGQTSDTLLAAQARPSSAMKMSGNYMGWKFAAVAPYWKINGLYNDGYPYFWWQTFANTPIVATNATTAISDASVTANGQITALGATATTAYGFCWNTTGNPTTADNKKDFGATAAVGTFNASIPSLNPCTTYYLRTFATNADGTAYGAQVSFILLDTQKPTISWDKGIQYIAANTALPNYTAQATVTDNCDISKLTITQTPSANSIIGSFPQTVSLTATDAGGNSAQISFEVRETIDTQYVFLNAGWNLVSLYVHPKDSTIETLFAGLDPIEVKDMTSFWRKGQAAEFNTLNKLSVGKGYFVNMKTGGTLINTGKRNNAIIPTIVPNFNWQLMAIPADPILDFTTFIAPVNGTVVKNFDEVWYYNASGSTMKVIKPSSAFFMRLNK